MTARIKIGILSAAHMHAYSYAACLNEIPDAELAVLVPGGLHKDEALRVLQRFEPIRPTLIGFSKIDDCGRIGELVTAVVSTKLPLAFVTTGHHVPQDLRRATPLALAELLLDPGLHNGEGRELQP